MQRVSSKHSGTVDALSWKESNISKSKNDILSWEGSTIKKISKSSSLTSHHSAKSKDSTNTASSDQIRKSVSQHSNVPSSKDLVIPTSSHHSKMGGVSQHTSTSQSKVTAQLLEHNCWSKTTFGIELKKNFRHKLTIFKKCS